VIVKLLLVVVPVQISDILEPGDLYIVCPSRIELCILLLYELKRLCLVLVYVNVSASLAKVQTLVLVVCLAFRLLFSEPSLLLCLSVLVL
jgi:hypothetical protein